MTEIGMLMDILVSDAMLDDGASPAVLASRGSVVRAKKKSTSSIKRTHWTDEEDQFLQDNLGMMALGEIAKTLGRSKNACKIRFTKKGYPAPTKQAGWITLCQAAHLLGVDSHATPGWFRRGIIPGRYAVTGKREVVVMKFSDLKFWATRPQNWPYFKVDRMAPGHLRRLVEKAQVRWNDEWLTTSQVADLQGLKNSKTVLTDIQHGNLPAIQCPHIGGRDRATWSYWFIKKSDLLTYKHPTRHDAHTKAWFTDRAEDYLRTLVVRNKNSADAARLMKQNQKYLSYRMNKLRKQINND